MQLKTSIKMKKTILLWLFASLSMIGYCQPKITNLVFHSSVSLFDLYEITFQLGTYDNPYDPEVIDVYAEMMGPDGSVTRVNGFYYEDYEFEKQNRVEKATLKRGGNGWKIRFTPQQVGSWRFTLHAIDKTGKAELRSIADTKCAFRCVEANTAQGFIRKANTRYLKREVVENGVRKQASFFPIGPNVAWYNCTPYSDYSKPMGIYDYERYMDSLRGNANYMRIWLTRYQYLSLYGPEHTELVQGKPKVYFDNTLNQKDAAELDRIIQMAADNGIAVMPCIFTYGDFKTSTLPAEQHPSDWRHNPFNTVLGLKKPSDVFTDARAQRVMRNLLRYVAARWGYATNIVAWELWNEVTNMDRSDVPAERFQNNLLKWHKDMAAYLRSQDPYHHLVTTSMGGTEGLDLLNQHLYESLDFSQTHNYQNIHKAFSKAQFSYILYNLAAEMRKNSPAKPAFVGEFGFGQSSAERKYEDHDPRGIDIHNSLWSSLFSGTAGTASFWFWDVLTKCGLFSTTRPMMVFSQGLPILSDAFTPQTTGYVSRSTLVFPNNLETYYLINATEDTLLGWSQDTAFCYQSLRHITNKTVVKGHFVPDKVTDREGYVYTLDPRKRPRPSSRNNGIEIPIAHQPVGTQYVVKWYDAETGHEMENERTSAVVSQDRRGNRQLKFEFPSSVRDLKNRRINNTDGDAVFCITKKATGISSAKNTSKQVTPQKSESDTKNAAPKTIKVVRPR